MKEYLVTNDGDWDNIFIVSAKDAKDAINQVFEEYFELQNEGLRKENKELGYYANHIFTKSDLSAKSIGSLHNRDGKVIRVN
jgi:hypothetical protein